MLLSGVAMAGLLGLAGSSLAADIVEEPPAPEPTWTGFHIGVGGGYGAVLHDGFLEVFGETDDGSETVEFNNLLEFDDLGDESWLGAIEVGFDWQASETFVLGIFGDFTFADFDATASDLFGCEEEEFPDDCIGKQINIETDNIWTIGGRIGFLTSPSTLWYGLAGYSNGRVSVNADVLGGEDEILNVFNFLDDDDRVDGFTVGAGVETLITDRFSLKLEYRYTDLGSFSKLFDSDDCDDCTIELKGDNLEAEVDFFDTDFDTRMQSIRVMFSWRL
jgi:outer membrane immunogenic protein